MGELEKCRICRRPVLELEGQFEILQPYYLPPGDPALEISGWLHTTCLANSEHGKAWARQRVNHFTGVRGYEVVHDTDDWTVLIDRRRRALLAFHRDGGSIVAENIEARVTPCDGGGTVEIERDSHLTLDDPAFVASLQQEITKQKRVPLAKVVDHLEIGDRLQWPGILKTGVYVLSKKLRGDWTRRTFSARVHYEEFLPEAVVAAWNSLRSVR